MVNSMNKGLRTNIRTVPYIFVNLSKVDKEKEDEYNHWYDEVHMPDALACPGFLWGERFKSVEYENTYVALYGLDSPAALQSDELRAVSGFAHLTQHVEYVTRLLKGEESGDAS